MEWKNLDSMVTVKKKLTYKRIVNLYKKNSNDII